MHQSNSLDRHASLLEIKNLCRTEYAPTTFLEEIIPVFAPRTEEEIRQDKYEDAYQNVDAYTGAVAYAGQLLNMGGTEGVYAAISLEILKSLLDCKKPKVLDVGCGVGRTIYDLAGLFKGGTFIGLDRSYQMLRHANQILKSDKTFEIDLSAQGFSTVKIQGQNYSNAYLVQGDALNLPFNENSFDCLSHTFLLDRVGSPELALEEAARVLKKNGKLILTSPLNFISPQQWNDKLSPKKVLLLLKNAGFKITKWHDGLPFRQVIDARGNFYEFKTLFVSAIKK